MDVYYRVPISRTDDAAGTNLSSLRLSPDIELSLSRRTSQLLNALASPAVWKTELLCWPKKPPPYGYPALAGYEIGRSAKLVGRSLR